MFAVPCAFSTEDQITHEINLEDVHDPQVGLDVFKVGDKEGSRWAGGELWLRNLGVAWVKV